MSVGLSVRVCITAGLLALAATGATAQDLAPTPHRAPRVAVDRQVLPGHPAVTPPSRTLDGDALVVDSERIKINGVEFRLYGIVSPQLSASYGPQTRAVLDKLAQGSALHCQIHDRAADGHLLASCSNGANQDLALELLKKGLAVVGRNTLTQSPLATAYLAAEQAAQGQKVGLWAGVSAPKPEVKVETPPAPIKEVIKEGPVKVDPVSASSLAPNDREIAFNKEAAAAAAAVIAANPAAWEVPAKDVDAPSFLERYQLLATGLLMLFTALAIIAAVLFQRRIDRREELRALAAALRGELMAARAVCLARLQQTVADRSTFSWPRIRVLVFQSHVGRIGFLGAELARQVASIYGLASDYAAYYRPGAEEEGPEFSSKHQALQKLVGHIDTVLPRLASIESRHPWMGPTRLLSRFKAPLSLPPSGTSLPEMPSKPLAAPVTRSTPALMQPAPMAQRRPITPRAVAAAEMSAPPKVTPVQDTKSSAAPKAEVPKAVSEKIESSESTAPVVEAEQVKEISTSTLVAPVEIEEETPVSVTTLTEAPVEAAEIESEEPKAEIEKVEVVEVEEITPVLTAPAVSAVQPEASAPVVESSAPAKDIQKAMAEVSFAEKVEEPVKVEAEKKTLRTVSGTPHAQGTATKPSKKAPNAGEAKKQAVKSEKQEPLSQVMREEAALAAALAWERMRMIKEFLHENLVPHPAPLDDENEEYLAMLRDEAEAFANYDAEEVEEAPRPRKRRRSS